MRASLFRTPSGSLAPRVGKPQVPKMCIHVEYDLSGYYKPGAPVGTVTFAEAFGARYSLAPKSACMSADDGATESHAPAKERSKKREATVFNQCS